MVLAVGVTMMTDAAVAGLIGFGGLTLGLLGVLSTWIICVHGGCCRQSSGPLCRRRRHRAGHLPSTNARGCPACGNVSVEAGAGRPTRQNIASP
jgi:hypothetical protein